MQDDQHLKELGLRLRKERLSRNESQAVFAARVGVSIPTLYKMESGDPTIPIGRWSTALFILDRLDELDTILQQQEDLFAKYAKSVTATRKRASRKTNDV